MNRAALVAVGLILAGFSAATPTLIFLNRAHAGPFVDTRAFEDKLVVDGPKDTRQWLAWVISGVRWSPSGVSNESLVAQARRAGFDLPDFELRVGNLLLPELGTAATSSTPKPDVVIVELDDWTEVALAVARSEDRVLVVEYPPLDGLARFWLRGRGWPEGVPSPVPFVGGLVPADRLMRVLRFPKRIEWSETPAVGPRSKIDHAARSGSTALAVVGLILAYIVGCSGYVAAGERLARFARLSLRALAIFLPAICFEGWITRLMDYPPAWTSLGISVVAAALIVTLVAQLTKPSFNDSWHAGIGVATFFGVLAGGWHGGVLDPRLLGAPQSGTPIVLAASLGAMAFVAQAGPRGWARTLPAAVGIGSAWIANIGDPVAGAAVIVLSAACLGAKIPQAFGLLTLLLPSVWQQWIANGFTAASDGTIRSASELGATRLDEWIRWSRDPVLIASLSLAALVIVMGGRFVLYRLKLAYRQRPALKCLATAAFALLGVATAFSSALIALTGVIVLGLFFAALSLATDLEPTLQ